MFKTIFSKRFTITLATILLSFTFAGVFLYNFLGNYIMDTKGAMMQEHAEKVRELTALLLDADNSYVEKLYFSTLASSSDSLQAAVFVTDTTGMVVISSGTYNAPKVGTMIENHITKQVQNGETVREISNFGNGFSQQVLTVAMPFTYKEKNNGGIYLVASLPEIYSSRAELFQKFIIAGLIGLLFAFIATFLLSKMFSRPIRKMKAIVEKIADGQFEERVSIKSDGELMELADSINAMADSLSQLEEMRSSFVANVSHELRSPLTSIMGYIDGMLDGTIEKKEQEKYLQIVKDETKRLTRLVNSLLTASRYEDKQVQLSRGIFDINELVRVTVLGFEAPVTEKSIEIFVSFHSENLFVKGDEDSYKQVVTNLIDNAVKFTPEHGKIKITSYKAMGKVYVSVNNTGTVISREDMKHLFDRFYKTDASRGDKKGTGLGLYIVKNILLKQGQNIAVQSDELNGTTFTFTAEPAKSETK